jgi:hypothetical protein
MSTWEALKGIPQRFGNRCSANGCVNESPPNAQFLPIAAYDMGGDVGQIWIAEGKSMGPWLAKDDFESLSNEEP